MHGNRNLYNQIVTFQRHNTTVWHSEIILVSESRTQHAPSNNDKQADVTQYSKINSDLFSRILSAVYTHTHTPDEDVIQI